MVAVNESQMKIDWTSCDWKMHMDGYSGNWKERNKEDFSSLPRSFLAFTIEPLSDLSDHVFMARERYLK